MSKLPIPQLLLALRDLLGERLGQFRRSAVCRGYESALRRRLTELEGLPDSIKGQPIAEEVEAVDRRHDGYGAAIYFVTEAYLRSPSVSAELRQTAGRIRRELVPELAELRASYADEADNAARRRQKLEELGPLARRIPVVNGTLEDWILAYIEAGEQIGRMLDCAEQVQLDSNCQNSRRALELQAAALRLLRQVRMGLREEVDTDPLLPQQLEELVFGYFDALEQQL
ncbi:MAG: hypothetical protein RBU37_21825 [Myxococcota bacterium]|nr:hypothetical protein [Myxococcota bacterium]